MNDSTWLESLKPGDEVVCVSLFGYAMSILPVERVTATQIVVGGDRYRRKDGEKTGADQWNRAYLRQPDDATRQRIRKSDLSNRLQRKAWGALPLETMEAVAALVWPSDKEKQG
jgi:hypothetical protein